MVEENPIKTTVEELRKLIDVKNFIGEPIETEDKILIPVVKMGIGFGAGNGKGANEVGGHGAAAAAGVEPIAMVVVSKGVDGAEGIRTLDLTKGNNINKAITDLGLVATDLIKDITGIIKDKKENEEEPAIINVKDTEDKKENTE